MGAPQVGPALVFFDAIVVSSHDLAWALGFEALHSHLDVVCSCWSDGWRACSNAQVECAPWGGTWALCSDALNRGCDSSGRLNIDGIFKEASQLHQLWQYQSLVKKSIYVSWYYALLEWLGKGRPPH
jgi:hypothetical protein